MGRPALQEEEKRVVQVNIRLTEAENKKVNSFAEASGISPANWIRQKAFTGRFPMVKLSPLNAAVYRELHMIGINLNQAVKQLHAGKLSPAYLNILTMLLKTLQDVLKALMQ
ncbi:plasmid mobilization protein [Mucilaginibacter ginkgonis]|uniref:Uncharacterized protein n=1 Tax=Mucilaginibacter ginkgonis TaxID=2682091 RepID=A0A6I4IMX5_9SPHI|nr:plasmid mobilization relaxosome protein MobC [Mucilaginibacter ginkgonis]QQL51208.1 hypothetical protein GO620_007100 [Mucilaginibacter ginkgonis]